MTTYLISDAIVKILLEQNVLYNPCEYFYAFSFSAGEHSDSLFSSFVDDPEGGFVAAPEAKIVNHGVLCASDDVGSGFGELLTLDDTKGIRSRFEKSKQEQYVRTKQKAEVFTPSWICNQQNNLVDGESYPGAIFNTQVDSSWTPAPDKVFSSADDAVGYIGRYVLEACCGEAPYLTSRYDTVTGAYIPVRDGAGRYGRIGLLDRKLRVASEWASSVDEWVELALLAVRRTFGYEFQGDNLFLARRNMVLNFVEHYIDFSDVFPNDDLVLSVARIVSRNIWQMDALKQVLPGSCSGDCVACSEGWATKHDGLHPVLWFKGRVIPYDDFLLTARPVYE